MSDAYADKTIFTDILNEDYNLYDLIPYETIKALLEAHQRTLQVALGLVSPSNELLLSVGFQPICANFHRVHPDSCAACIESNAALQKKLLRDGMAAERCRNGLWDFAMPIMVRGRHLASVFIGQFLYADERVDRDFFIARARRFGYDEKAYLHALQKVPRISPEHAENMVRYTANLVELLAELGLKNLQLTREIRERKLAEYALWEGERRYKALIENVPGAVYLCLHDDAYTTIFVSDAIEDLTGFSSQKMIDEAMPIMDLIHVDDRPTVVQLVNEAVAKKQTYVLKYRMLRKDGGYTWVEERGQGVRDDTGELRFLQGVIFDISEHEQFEEKRRKIEAQMARAHNLESLGVLAGGIAHDFNNLLAGILGHAELIREDLGKNTPAYESLKAIISAAHCAADLTRKMLDYSGKGHFHSERANISTLVREAKPLIETQPLKNYDFHYELHESLPEILIDIGQFNQILISLVNNGAESYRDEKGPIIIRTGLFNFEDNTVESAYLGKNIPAGSYVFLEVSDHGCGMDEAIKKRICDPFFSTKFAGRGLSMAAVIGIIRGHNGHLLVDTAPQRGTTVRVLFPVYFPIPESSSVSEHHTRNGSILLVDDESVVRLATMKMLMRAGYKVLTAENSPKAITLSSKHNGDICCVIFDLTMPEVKGRETLQQLRIHLPEVPVILSSGYSWDTIAPDVERWGIAAFLQKPYDFEKLSTTIKKVLSYND